MHWLEQQVVRLAGLADDYQQSLAFAGSGPSGVARMKDARSCFVGAVREVVTEVARRTGVTACFACHDGLVMEAAGRAPDFDALSAMTQSVTVAAKDAAITLALGKVQQMVIVGDEHKLALFVLGQFAIGILSPTATHLGQALSR